MIPRNREEARVWRCKDLRCLDLLSASYVRHSFTPHSHDTYVIGIIEAGAEAFEIRGNRHVAPAGSIVLVDPGEVHTGSAVGDDGWTYRAMYPSTGLMASAASQALGAPTLPHFPNAVVFDPGLSKEFRYVIHELENGVGGLEGHGLLLNVLGKLISRHGDPSRSFRALSIENQAINVSVDYIQANCHQPITLTELSNLAGLSPFHFLRVFQKATGLTPHAYCTQARIERAKCMLGEGWPIGHVAAETGFTDQSHLTKWFKRFVGVTPGRYL